MVAAVPGLDGHISPTYPSWNLSIPDAKRIDAWLEPKADDVSPA